MKRRFPVFIAIFILGLPLLLLGAMNSETGSRWLLNTLFSLLPSPQITVKNIEGRILDKLSLNEISYRSNQEKLSIQKLDLLWQPSRLLSGLLKIDELAVIGIDIGLTKTPGQENKPANFETDIKLPFQVDIGNVLLERIKIIQANDTLAIDRFQLRAKTEENSLNINKFIVNAEHWNAGMTGTIKLAVPLPVNLKAEWDADADQNGAWKGIATVSGNLDHLVFEHHLDAPFASILQGHVDHVLNDPKILATVDWKDLSWPPNGKPSQIQSPTGHLELDGLLNKYQIKLNAELTQPDLPKTGLTFEGKGGLEALAVNTLALKSKMGLFNLNGNVSWKNGTSFDLSAVGDQFNPAILIPELPGNLKIDSRIHGLVGENNLQIAADIKKLSGQLRKQPLNATGNFNFQDNNLDVDGFKLNFGANNLQADGSLGTNGKKLDFELDMPMLNAFWPTLSGKLTGKGQLEGELSHPSAQVVLQGKRIRFGDSKLEKLAVDIDYVPSDRQSSNLKFLADGLEHNDFSISKLSIEGSGTTQQHHLKADVVSPDGSIFTRVEGKLLASGWKGDVNTVNITDGDKNEWSLDKKFAVQVDKKPEGIDIKADKNCLSHQDTSLCSQLSYQANSDFNLDIEAKALPTELIQPFLPETLVISSRVDADLKLQRQNNALDGRYRVNLSPVDISITDNTSKRNITLGASSLKGNIKGEQVSGDFNLNLASHDFIRGNLKIDTGKNQAFSGRVAASIDDFSPIQPFVNQLSAINGHLRANLALNGTIKRPLIAGNIDLTGGEANVGEPDKTRIGLRHIDFHAIALENRPNKLKLTASVIPEIINNADSPEKVGIKGLFNLDADLGWADSLSGNFRLSTPTATTVSFETQESKNQFVFGASSISGRMEGKAVETNLDLTLTGQDFIRGNLQFDSAANQIVSGQLNASIQQLAILETLLPQASNVKGAISADMAVKGSLQAPQLNGSVRLKDGAVDVDEFGLAIREINLDAITSVDNPRMVALKGSSKSGDGSITLDGNIALEPELHYPIELNLVGQNFEAAKIPEAQVIISPDLKLALSNTKKLISGQVEIPKASIQLNELPENAVKVSEDEVILGEQKPESEAIQTPGIDADIEIKLGKEVSFKGMGLQTGLSGRLKIVKSNTQMAMQGNVDMDKGSYKRFGQNLTVRKGRFLFNGPADNPWLDVEATRLSKSQKVTAILTLSGTLKNPQTHISSEPALPETEALAYLVTGGPLNQVSKSDSNMLASAALSFGAGQASWLTEKLGINEFKVVEGSTLKDTLLVMGQYLTPDFYVGTKIGMFNKQASLVLKHKLTDTVNVETQTGTSQRIKLNYEFDGD